MMQRDKRLAPDHCSALLRVNRAINGVSCPCVRAMMRYCFGVVTRSREKTTHCRTGTRSLERMNDPLSGHAGCTYTSPARSRRHPRHNLIRVGMIGDSPQEAPPSPGRGMHGSKRGAAVAAGSIVRASVQWSAIRRPHANRAGRARTGERETRLGSGQTVRVDVRTELRNPRPGYGLRGLDGEGPMGQFVPQWVPQPRSTVALPAQTMWPATRGGGARNRSQQTPAWPLHGGGLGFEPPQLHRSAPEYDPTTPVRVACVPRSPDERGGRIGTIAPSGLVPER
jgi:hypothetical protein